MPNKFQQTKTLDTQQTDTSNPRFEIQNPYLDTAGYDYASITLSVKPQVGAGNWVHLNEDPWFTSLKLQHSDSTVVSSFVTFAEDQTDFDLGIFDVDSYNEFTTGIHNKIYSATVNVNLEGKKRYLRIHGQAQGHGMTNPVVVLSKGETPSARTSVRGVSVDID